MYDQKVKPRAKSYPSIYEIFGSNIMNNLFCTNAKYSQSVKENSLGDNCTRKSSLKDTELVNRDEYITSEKYHVLNKNHSSHNSIVRSKSTIFYDLDEIVKRHSFHCITEVTFSNSNILQVMNLPLNTTAIGGNSDIIVQECATQIHPRLKARDSVAINSKKLKKHMNNDYILSSEIFLRDDDYTIDYDKKPFYNKESERPQRFWSYAKYRTEYLNPISGDKNVKKKDRGKRTEDPCPCQLFSYACPCTNKKSLTELANNNKSIPVNTQITSTTKFYSDDRKDKPTKKQRQNMVREDKPTNTSNIEIVEVLVPRNEQLPEIVNVQNTQILADGTNQSDHKSKSRKKLRKIICPNCKEKVEVYSTTEEEEYVKNDSSIYRRKGIASTEAYAYRVSSRTQKRRADDDVCDHEPRCELVPVCQILPNKNLCMSQKSPRKHSSLKNTPRVIRITKACRHHPPCTVVPSCQKANVLRNNCEYIPPCLHRPRCINLPLCVPFSKSFHYEKPPIKCNYADVDSSAECPHVPKCRYISVCQRDSLKNNADQVNMETKIENRCNFVRGCPTPTFLMNPHTYTQNKFPPSPIRCNNSKSNKSCQFDSSQYRLNKVNVLREAVSIDTVIFIRDVGCQFQNKTYSPKDSILQSNNSSYSINFADVKMGNYYSNYHTLRYEDKCTTPISKGNFSLSDSLTSMEIDVHDTSHGGKINSPKISRQTGFNPKSTFVAAYNTQFTPLFTSNIYRKKRRDLAKSDFCASHDHFKTNSVKSRKSLLHSKYKKVFYPKRKGKSNTKQRISDCSSRNALSSQI